MIISRSSFAEIVREKYADADVIAGVATGAIAVGALVADLLNKPFIYIRSAPKGHGLENMIEGVLEEGQKVVIIEDLISTGGSSLKAVEAVRERGGVVMGMLAIFSYGFQTAEDNFKTAGVDVETLSNYNTLLQVALDNGIVSHDDLQALGEWRKDPANWKR